MKKSEAQAQFWEQCCGTNPDLDLKTDFDVWHFGDNRELADRLVELVLDGRKRATAALAWEADGEETPPRPGDISLVTNFDGEPKCFIRYTDIVVLPFDQVDEDFAFEEGEGDGSLDYWRAAHWAFFSRYCATIGREPDMEMPVICKRFEVLFPAHG